MQQARATQMLLHCCSTLEPTHAHVMHARQHPCTGMPQNATSMPYPPHRVHLNRTSPSIPPPTSTCCMRHSTTHSASGTGHYPVVKLLIEKAQVPVDPRDASGATPLLLAVQRGAQATVIYLVSKGADMEVCGVLILLGGRIGGLVDCIPGWSCCGCLC